MSRHACTHARTHARSANGENVKFLHFTRAIPEPGIVEPLSPLATPLGTVFLPLLHMPLTTALSTNHPGAYKQDLMELRYHSHSCQLSQFVALSTFREIQVNSMIHPRCLNMQIGKSSLFTFHLRVHSSRRHMSHRPLCCAVEI